MHQVKLELQAHQMCGNCQKFVVRFAMPEKKKKRDCLESSGTHFAETPTLGGAK